MMTSPVPFQDFSGLTFADMEKCGGGGTHTWGYCWVTGSEAETSKAKLVVSVAQLGSVRENGEPSGTRLTKGGLRHRRKPQ